LKGIYNLHFRTSVSLSLCDVTKGYKTMQEADAQGIYTHFGFIIRRLLICYSFQLYNVSMASLKRAGIAFYSNKLGVGRFGTLTLTGQKSFPPKKVLTGYGARTTSYSMRTGFLARAYSVGDRPMHRKFT